MPTIRSLPLRAVSARRAVLLDVRRFIARNGQAVGQAVELIAGPCEREHVEALMLALGRAVQLTPPLHEELERLHALLRLELDPCHGAAIAPGHPVVHDLCLITDTVGDLLRVITAPAPCPAPAAATLVPTAVRARRRATG